MRSVLFAGACAAFCLTAAAVQTSSSAVFIVGPRGSAATPSIAAEGRRVVVAFSESASSGATDVYAAVSDDGGRSFASPVRVNDVAGEARVGGEQPPRVAVHDRRIVVVWTAKGQKGTRLLQARSDDGGRTFSRAAAVPGSEAAGNRGWENANARYAVWLDHRELAQDETTMTAMHHQHESSGAKPDGVAMAQKSKLFFGSLDGSIAAHAITGGVCYCCKTALAESGDGSSIFLAWRHVYPGNFRDIAFTMSKDGGRSFAAPIRVSEDKWMLEGCPDDGPAIAVDVQHRVHLVWPTLIADATSGEQSIGLFYATSADGHAFTPRERIPTQGIAHHPQITIGSDGLPLIAWDESDQGARRILVGRRRTGADGARFVCEAVGDAGVYPALTASDGAAVAAWTARHGDSAVAVRRLEH